MKGIIFAEFAEFAAGALPAGTEPSVSYDPSASYPDDALLELASRADAAAALPPGESLRRFGAYLFGSFVRLYPVFFVGVESALELLGGIETWVHGEVQKLYPDARFPSFEVRSLGPGRLEMVYRSDRPLADLAEGLIRGCVDHFGEPVDVQRRDLDARDGRAAAFTLRARPRGVRPAPRARLTAPR